MNKTALRSKLTEKRSAIEERAHKQQNAIAQLQYFLEKMQGICGIYMPIKDELPPLSITDNITHLQWATPVTHGNDMHFVQWTPDMEMQASSFGIKEPAEQNIVTPNIIITPLLGFDARGHRLGYGKGYYDRYFASDAGKNALRIGLAFACQQVRTIPHEPHDTTLHATITEHGMMRHIAE